MLRDRALVAQLAQAPLPRRLRVAHRLERRERLRGDDEQRLGRVEVARRLGEVRGIDVRDEAERERAIGVVAQGLRRHHRAEIRAADSEIHDVADALARVTPPGSAAHALRERAHAIEHGVDLRDDVLPVQQEPLLARRPQRDVQDGAPLRGVDLLAAEHRVDARAQAGLFGQREAAAAASRRVIRCFE